MRLLKTDRPLSDSHGLEMLEFFGEDIPEYTILSHTWSEEEVLFVDIQDQTYHRKKGFTKLKYAIEQSRRDGYKFLWADTCCIDKSSSADLSEAVNSMFSWYSGAAKCYAYLMDVHQCTDLDIFTHQFRRARWWTRGWTLQELLASRHLEFFSSTWKPIGRKIDLQGEISEITQIDLDFLDGSRPISSASISKRMSWASSRVTTRPEDMAYCLMGIFSVNMPLLYGEGRKAFIRLQEEIMKHSDDQSIFAWRADESGSSGVHPLDKTGHGLLADSPKAFTRSGNYYSYHDWQNRKPYGTTNRGISIELPLTTTSASKDVYLAALQCPPQPGFDGYLAVFLQKIAGTTDQYARIHCSTLATIDERGKLKLVYVPQGSAVRTAENVYPHNFFSLRHFRDDLIRPRSDDSRHLKDDFRHLMDGAFGGKMARHVLTEYSCIPTTSLEQVMAPQGEAGVASWVKPSSGHAVTVFKIFKRAGRLTVVFLLRPEGRSQNAIAILLGCISDYEVGFDVCEVDEGQRKRIPRVEEYDRIFSPQAMGSVAVLPRLQVQVDAEEMVESGKKVYLIDIRIGSTSDALYGCLPFTSFNDYSVRKARLKKAESPTINDFRFPSVALNISPVWQNHEEDSEPEAGPGYPDSKKGWI